MYRGRGTLTKYRQKQKTAQRKSQARDPVWVAERERVAVLRKQLRDSEERKVQRLAHRPCPHCKNKTLKVNTFHDNDEELTVEMFCESPLCRTRHGRRFGNSDFQGNPSWISRSCWQGFVDTKNWFVTAIAKELMGEPDGDF